MKKGHVEIGNDIYLDIPMPVADEIKRLRRMERVFEDIRAMANRKVRHEWIEKRADEAIKHLL